MTPRSSHSSRRFVTLVVTTVLIVTTLTGPAVGTAAHPTSGPGAGPWNAVPRERVARVCGLDPDLMDKASLQMIHTPFAVVRHGRLCWTGGYPGGTTTPYAVNSVTKTMGALLVGMVAARSALDDTDRVTDWVPQAELGAINPRATIAHVLSMTSTSPDLSYGEKEPWSYDALGDREINVLVDVMNRAIARQPGRFPGVSDVREFAQKELFDTLGMSDSSWPGENLAYSMTSTPEDLARMGLLILRRGRWQGEQLLEERFLYRMTHPAFEDVNTGYGYLTYANAAANETYSSGTSDTGCSPFTTWPRYPHSPFFEAPHANGGSPFAPGYDVGLVWAAGAGGQRISVHRGLDLVITVRDEAVSTDVEEPGTFEGHKNVWKKIRPALVAMDERFHGDEEAFCAAYRRSKHAPDLRDPWSTSASR